MAADRSLPERRNPLVSSSHTPQINLLVERRRLGQTELSVKAGQVNTSNATKKENLGMFDYAHLRVPLPKDLEGSGIFSRQRNGAFPEAYFLMRRSSDGFISATGMYKAAFPWSSQEQEETEKRYIKSFPETGPEEVAGNVWISPSAALELADEYDMRVWIEALLDPAPIPKGTHDPTKRISTPPRFVVPRSANSPDRPSLPPPEPMSARKRSLRSASPSKAPPLSNRKIATPRRTRRGRPAGSSNLATAVESAAEDSSQAHDASVEPESVNGDAIRSFSAAPAKPTIEEESAADDDTVQVGIKSTTEDVIDSFEPTKITTVTVDTFASQADLKTPTDPQIYLDQAKAAIVEANKLTAGRAAGRGAGRKRKALEMLDDDTDSAAEALDGVHSDSSSMAERPTKRLRKTETELRKEKIKRRALFGIAASMTIGAMLPVAMGTFFSAL